MTHASRADLAGVADELSKLFGWYALWSVGEHQRASPGKIQDWCQLVAKQAHDLLHTLGHDRDYLSCPSFEDTLLHLAPAWPSLGSVTQGPDRERHALHKLEMLARNAVPERYKALKRDRAHDPAREAAWDSIGKPLALKLHLLQMLAERGAAYHGQFVRRGGSGPEEARAHLFCQLCEQYRRLFGSLPAAPSPTVPKAQTHAGELRASVPGGAGFKWFRGLLDLLGQRANALIKSGQEEGATPDAERDRALVELTGLVKASRKGKAGDGLAWWIRDNSAIVKRHKLDPAPADAEPSLPNGWFEDVFVRQERAPRRRE